MMHLVCQQLYPPSNQEEILRRQTQGQEKSTSANEESHANSARTQQKTLDKNMSRQSKGVARNESEWLQPRLLLLPSAPEVSRSIIYEASVDSGWLYQQQRNYLQGRRHQ